MKGQAGEIVLMKATGMKENGQQGDL